MVAKFAYSRPFTTLVTISLIGLATTCLWLIFDWPPPGLIIEYGLPPASGPTGRKLTCPYGITYIEMRPGYTYVHRNVLGEWKSTTWRHLGERIGLVNFCRKPSQARESRYVVMSTHYWISARPVGMGITVRSPALQQRCQSTEEFLQLLSKSIGTVFRTASPDEMYYASPTLSNLDSTLKYWSHITTAEDGSPKALYIGDNWKDFSGSEIEWMVEAMQHMTQPFSDRTVDQNQHPWLVTVPLPLPFLAWSHSYLQEAE